MLKVSKIILQLVRKTSTGMNQALNVYRVQITGLHKTSAALPPLIVSDFVDSNEYCRFRTVHMCITYLAK